MEQADLETAALCLEEDNSYILFHRSGRNTAETWEEPEAANLLIGITLSLCFLLMLCQQGSRV